jgi:hypothetical protein
MSTIVVVSKLGINLKLIKVSSKQGIIFQISEFVLSSDKSLDFGLDVLQIPDRRGALSIMLLVL